MSGQRARRPHGLVRHANGTVRVVRTYPHPRGLRAACWVVAFLLLLVIAAQITAVIHP